MKHLVLCFLVLSSSLLSAQGIQFFKGTFEEALEESHKTGKPIFLDIYTTWCAPCKMLEKTIFPLTRVGDFMNKAFINVKVDAERSGGKQLANKYNVMAYPSLLVVDADGLLIAHLPGAPVDPESFIGIIRDIYCTTSQGANLAAWDKTWDSEWHTPDLALEYFNMQKQYGLYSSCKLEDYLLGQNEDSLGTACNEKIILQYTRKTEGNAFEYIVSNQNKSIKFANKLNSLLEYHFEELMVRELPLESFLAIVHHSYSQTPQLARLKQGQYKNRYYLTKKDAKGFVEHCQTYVPEQVLPFLKSATEQTDSTLFQHYRMEMENIAWQYLEFVKKKKELAQALEWMEQMSSTVSPSILLIQYIAQLAHKSGDKPKAIRYLELAITQAKQQQQDVAELEKLLGEWR